MRASFFEGSVPRGALAAALAVTMAGPVQAAPPDRAAIEAQVVARHDTAVRALQKWIALPSIAAEDLNAKQGADYMARLARDAGFQHVEVVDTGGKPGVFATLDAGAPTTVGVYFMYDVKQYDPAEWSSPPLDARMVDKPGLGRAIVGRGATNQKGPEMAFLTALHAIHDAKQAMPVNLVLVAEGEEEIGSPNIGALVLRPDIQAALKNSIGVFMPMGLQAQDGSVTVNLGAKGVVELELVSDGATWGRGPARDVHSSLKAMVDSPAWRLVKALDTLVSEDGNTVAIDGFPEPTPLTVEERVMIAKSTAMRDEETARETLGVPRWIDDLPWQQANERLVSQPTVNIQGLVGGYTGAGGKTVLPHRAVAKIDMRLVPPMTRDGAVEALKAHLEKRGYGDIAVNVSGGYDPTSTHPDSRLIQAQVEVLRRSGVEPLLWPRLAGSYPGFVFTQPPLSLPAGHFGLGHGGGAHAPDEFFLIESSNPNVQGFDGAVMSYVDYLYELGSDASTASP